MPADLARDGLRALQQRMLRAAVERRDLSALELQRDTVEGARRLTQALYDAWAADACNTRLWQAHVEAAEYQRDAEVALARYEQATQLRGGPGALETGQ